MSEVSKMDLENTNTKSKDQKPLDSTPAVGESVESENSSDDKINYLDPDVDLGLPSEHLGSNADNLFGTLEIEGVGEYYLFLSQRRSFKCWTLTDKSIFESADRKANASKIEAILKVSQTGRMEGYGKTFLLTRLMVAISSATYIAINSSADRNTNTFIQRLTYTSEQRDVHLSYKTLGSGSAYLNLEMVYDGFRMSLDRFNGKYPYVMPALAPVQDVRTKAAIVTNLGVKTASALFRKMGDRLAWYKSKNYKLIADNESFKQMMLRFLTDVQRASANNRSVLLGLDTETTGLNMLDLKPDNPLRDSIVAIPFGWKDNEAYVICTDMYYFSNVNDELIYPLFDKLFSRNEDYTFQDINFDYGGVHFSFNRKNITVSGWNVMFDEQAFFSHNAKVFFDEDGRQLYFNLDTDLLQGEAGQAEFPGYRISNSLKMQTRRMIGDETLELDELFGRKHEDKYRYLQDQTLALVYGGADADYTRLCVKLGRKMTEPELYKQYRKYDMSLLYRCAEMAWRGMHVDTDAVRKLGEKVKEDLETLKEFIYHYAWLANRDTLLKRTDKLKELLGAEMDDDEFLSELGDGREIFRYDFTPENHKSLLFGMLGYPVIKRAAKTGKPALDKFVLQKLMVPQRKEPVEILKQDIMSVYDPEMKLVDKDQFNKDAYPLARVFQTYAVLNKEYTSYYKPIMQNDLEGKMFYGFTMAKAATRRILSPGQTMKGSLKSLVVAPPGKLFLAFDASQIEYRHMASLAYIRRKKLLQESYPDEWEQKLEDTTIARIVRLMHNEEADYHIETASAMHGIPQHQVSHELRKKTKSLGFGIPYGLGERSMCESLHKGVVNEQTMAETRRILEEYKQKQKDIIDLLESTRDSAFVPAPLTDMHREYMRVGESHVGLVRNFAGFYRVFILENLTRARTGRIRRQAGNCIIQGGAAELFRRMLYNFHVSSVKAGISQKIQWVMLVHDELDAVIDDDIDIMLLIKVIYENCTLRYQDHIPYYIGIGLGSSWGEAKDDSKELPVIMVQRMVKAYDAGKFFIPCDGNQPTNLMRLKRHYMCDRIEECVREIFPNIKAGFVWSEEACSLVDEKLTNYVVRAYLDVFAPSKKASFKEKLEGWQKAREEYGFGRSFLTTPIVTMEDFMEGTEWGDNFDLSVDLLDNSSEEEAINTGKADSTWFKENSLFDQNARAEDILSKEEDIEEDYLYTNLESKEDEYVENPNPTSAFDVFVSKQYVRMKVLKVNDTTATVMLSGTKYANDISILAHTIRKQFSSGSGSLVLVGNTIGKIDNVDFTEENLNWLDQVVCGKLEV